MEIRLISSKELATMNVRYIDTGRWEITAGDGKKVYCRTKRQAFYNIQIGLKTTAKDARQWMAMAEANPIPFAELIPYYAEIIRYEDGSWQILNKDGTWDNRGTKTRIRSALKWVTDLSPEEMTQVLDHVERARK